MFYKFCRNTFSFFKVTLLLQGVFLTDCKKRYSLYSFFKNLNPSPSEIGEGLLYFIEKD